MCGISGQVFWMCQHSCTNGCNIPHHTYSRKPLPWKHHHPLMDAIIPTWNMLLMSTRLAAPFANIRDPLKGGFTFHTQCIPVWALWPPIVLQACMDLKSIRVFTSAGQPACCNCEVHPSMAYKSSCYSISAGPLLGIFNIPQTKAYMQLWSASFYGL